jgi:hypothetical protein
VTSIDPSPYSHDGGVVSALFTQLLTAAYNGLETPETRLGIPDAAYLSHDAPPEDCCDFLALWIRQQYPFLPGEFPQQLQPLPQRGCQPVQFAARLTLSLRRPCAPDLSADQFDPFPEPGEETAAAVDLMIDSRALICAVGSTWQGLVDGVYGIGIGQLHYSPLLPTGSATGCFGWDWDIDIALEGCKTACS